MKTYQVTLPDEFAEFIDRMIAEKKWDSADEVMLSGLASLQAEMRVGEDLDHAWLKAEIQKGIDSANRGALIDGPTAMARHLARLEGDRSKPA